MAIFHNWSSCPQSCYTPTYCINHSLLDSSHINLIIAPFCLESFHGVFTYLMLCNKSPQNIVLIKNNSYCFRGSSIREGLSLAVLPQGPCVVAVMNWLGLQSSEDWIGPFSLLLKWPTHMPGKPVVVIGRGALSARLLYVLRRWRLASPRWSSPRHQDGSHIASYAQPWKSHPIMSTPHSSG